MMENKFHETENLQVLARFDFLDVCLVGETGTGKSHTARVIHDLSPRAAQNFLHVNCAELSESIIEAELFGCEKGAFTGAISERKGKFEAAENGTLFLDEIGELPANIQAKLLKAVEEKQITRVGGTRPRSVNVRLVYATNRDLSVLREDFRYRIGAHTVCLKPLRERPEEIVPLARLFLLEFSRRAGRAINAEDDALKRLENLYWHGNVRELRSFVQKACLDVLFAAAKENRPNEELQLTEDFLAARLTVFTALDQASKADSISKAVAHFRLGDRMDDYIQKIEAHLLRRAMLANGNNQSRAARDLGLSRTGLIKKLKRMNH